MSLIEEQILNGLHWDDLPQELQARVIVRGAFLPARCCCNPDNLIGFLPIAGTLLEIRELEDGTFAFDSDHNADFIRSLPGFIEAGPKSPKSPKGPKTWRKK